MTEGTKTLFTSKTFRGAIIATIIPLMKTLGYDFSYLSNPELIEHLVTFIGAGIAVYGRIVAKEQIL
jgi:hypothetical protein